jgi:hypothetical protein
LTVPHSTQLADADAAPIELASSAAATTAAPAAIVFFIVLLLSTDGS